MSLSTGVQAPDFELMGVDLIKHSLSEYRGKWVLLYFYPKDDTPGCTKEACNFRDSFDELNEVITILGVSTDDIDSHRKFKEKYNLPFMILSDPEKQVIHLYQADGTLFPKRTSFLINPEGIIAKVYDKVNVNTHASQILRDIKGLQKE